MQSQEQLNINVYSMGKIMNLNAFVIQIRLCQIIFRIHIAIYGCATLYLR